VAVRGLPQDGHVQFRDSTVSTWLQLAGTVEAAAAFAVPETDQRGPDCGERDDACLQTGHSVASTDSSKDGPAI